MDKDRVECPVEQVAEAVKKAAGNANGDAELETEGEADKAQGGVHNAIGGMKDVFRDAIDKI